MSTTVPLPLSLFLLRKDWNSWSECSECERPFQINLQSSYNRRDKRVVLPPQKTEESLVFSAAGSLAARTRARQSLNTHPLFVIRRVGCVGRAVSRTWLRSTRCSEPPSSHLSRDAASHKVNSRYIIRHEAGTKNFVLCRGAPSTSPRLHDSLGKKYRRSISGENNEKYDARVITGQSRTNFR